MVVSGLDTDVPANADSAPNFDPRSKPVSLAFAKRTGPVMTSLSMGPAIARSADSVPPFNCDPEGSTTPSAGNMDSSSSTGMFGASSFILSTWVSPSVLKAPVRWAIALPIFTSPCVMLPELLSRFTSTVCLITTVVGAGDPFGENCSLLPVKVPTALAMLPFERRVPSKFANPAIPLAGSMNPEATISMLLTFTAASNGVFAASAELMGPAFPEMSALPPAGSFAVNRNGNCEVGEKLVTVMLTCSYTCGLAFEFALPTINFPSLTLSLPTDRFAGADDPEFEGADAFLVALPPRLEKFHFPSEVFSKVISGWSSAMSVTRSSLEVIKGMISTPTFRDFAVTNGVVPNAGSSAIAMLSAVTVPVRRERLRLPTLTWRPRASLAVASSLGRKLFTLTRKGIAIRITTSIATPIPTILRMRFMMFPAFCSGAQLRGWARTAERPVGADGHLKCIKDQPRLLRHPVEFRVGDRLALELFLALVSPLIAHIHGGLQLSLALVLTPHFDQDLSSQVVNSRRRRILLAGLRQLGDRLLVLFLPLVHLCQTEVGIEHLRLQLQRLPVCLLSVGVFFQQEIHVTQLVIVEDHVGLERDVFLERLHGRLVVAFFRIGHAQVEMHKRQLRIRVSGGSQLFHRFVVSFKIQLRLANQQTYFGRVSARLGQPRQRPVAQFLALRLIRGNAQHIQIIQIPGLLWPDRLQRVHGLHPSLGEEIALPQQKTRLHRVRLILQHRLKRRNRVPEVVLPVIGQPDIQANAGDLWCQFFRLAKICERPPPVLAPHCDHTQVRVSACRSRE